MLITETFHSIQGEGPLTGLPMFFVRTGGCNLRCRWCDSTYTFSGGTEIQLDELISQASGAWEEWICLTGGEPLLQKDAPGFVSSLTGAGKKVLVETGGSLPIDRYTEMDGTLIDMDIKTPSSGEQHSVRIRNLKLLRGSDYIKFVIADEDDYSYAVSFMKDNSYRGTAVFQPAYGNDYRWIPERMIKDRINARFMLQTHKHVWGEERSR